jgi:hypothetical protein
MRNFLALLFVYIWRSLKFMMHESWELKMKKEQNDEVIATQQQPNKDL